MQSLVLTVAVICQAALSVESDDQSRLTDGAQLKERAALALFESKIRPVLVKHCYECHSAKAKSLKGGLLLDTRDGIYRGGDTGPAVVSGKPTESLILQALEYRDDSVQMPPKGKLAASVIKDFRRWIASGALDPREGDGAADENAAAVKLWSLQPLAEPAVPTANDPWIRTDVDRFIWAKLVKKGLRPQAIVTPRRLIRRAYFDLIGLPPSPEQIESFVNDDDPRAYAKLVDDLLDSPHFGERWGRHWLDVARYADSSGYEFDCTRTHAYHYRDFVIEAFNRDQPYDEFIRWQIAGDELAPDNPLAHKATGFLACGPMNSVVTEFDAEKERYNVLDDWVATIGTAMLGLTTGCARCHDHKFDPLPAEDYYRMASTFTTTVRVNRNIDLDPAATRQARAAHAERHEALVAARERFEREQLPTRTTSWLGTDPPLDESPWLVLDAKSLNSSGNLANVITRFRQRADGAYLIVEANGEIASHTFEMDTPLADVRALRLEVLPDESLPRFGPGLGADGDFTIRSLVVTARPLTGAAEPVVVKLVNPRSGTASGSAPRSKAGENGAWSFTPEDPNDHWAVWDFERSVGWEDGARLQIQLQFDANHRDYRKALGCFRFSLAAGHTTPQPSAPALRHSTFVTARQALAVPARQRSAEQMTAIQQLAARYDADWRRLDDVVRQDWRDRPWPEIDVALVTTEAKQLVPLRMSNQGPDYYESTFLLQRGSVDRKSREVKPGFLRVLTRSPSEEEAWSASPPANSRTPFHRASLAHWLTDADQGAGHLLARVIVNRLWQHHLGQGLISTPSDFGSRGDRPTHPELLDWLATQLIAQNWSLKSLHRVIMTSAVYMQGATPSGLAESEAASPTDEAGQALLDPQRVDPGNRLFWRRPLVRLEAEVIRDAMLAVSGRLDRLQFGPGTLDESMTRRSIYFTVKRSALIPTLVQLDWPDTLNGIGRRPVTTVAPQSLLVLNNPQVRACAEAFAAGLVDGYEQSPEMAVKTAFVTAIGRSPTDREREVSLQFVRRQTDSYGPDNGLLAALADFCQMLLGMNEFFYVR
jgi:hypothetical protein